MKNQRIVQNVDLQKYQGKWYEIARKPAWFENKEAKNITATYKLLEDGTMSVLNSEEINGKIKSIEGVARVVNKQTNSELAVSFKGMPFEGQYWIVRLAGSSSNYEIAVVSDKGGRYLWILSRTKTTPYLEYMINSLKNEGYNLDDLIITQQD